MSQAILTDVVNVAGRMSWDEGPFDCHLRRESGMAQSGLWSLIAADRPPVRFLFQVSEGPRCQFHVHLDDQLPGL